MGRKKKKKRSGGGRNWTYRRALFLTVGLILSAFAIALLARDPEGGRSTSDWVATGVFLSFGLVGCGMARWASDGVIKRWSSGARAGDDGDGEDASIVISIIAWPVYWVGNLFRPLGRRR